MIRRKVLPYEKLTDKGSIYEIVTDEDEVIVGELRGWEFDEANYTVTFIIWKQGESRGWDFHQDEIMDVKKVR